jgi:hypothetical protein
MRHGKRYALSIANPMLFAPTHPYSYKRVIEEKAGIAGVIN